MYDKLRHARVCARITQAKMGELVGLSMAGYRQKENGERKITIEDGIKMAEVLGKSLDELFWPSIDQHTNAKGGNEI